MPGSSEAQVPYNQLQFHSANNFSFFSSSLKMNFIDVGNGNGNGLNTGKAPVLATVFSDVFQVYSAKKFPGVIESTPLSRVFASQGIKIPIRKDGPKMLSNQAEYDADE